MQRTRTQLLALLLSRLIHLKGDCLGRIPLLFMPLTRSSLSPGFEMHRLTGLVGQCLPHSHSHMWRDRQPSFLGIFQKTLRQLDVLFVQCLHGYVWYATCHSQVLGLVQLQWIETIVCIDHVQQHRKILRQALRPHPEPIFPGA